VSRTRDEENKKRKKTLAGWIYKDWFKSDMKADANWVSLPIFLPDKDENHTVKVRITIEEI